MALFDPRLEVVAVTAVAGNVSAEQATLNVQAIIEQLDPPQYPRMGAATASETVRGPMPGICTATTAWGTPAWPCSS